MWGNDPGRTPTSAGALTESIILNRTIGDATLKLGWAGRLNGPVDNPASACISCHGTAQHPFVSGVVPTGTDTAKLRWFRNLPSGTPFDAGGTSLDYSLQLATGIRNFFSDREPPVR